MIYENIITGKFISRPNRFIALVELEAEASESAPVKAHVKNTGRLGELLIPGAKVFLEDHEGRMGTRKLRYSLIAVSKSSDGGDVIVNVDSQAPNKIVKEALQSGRLLPAGISDAAKIKAEYKYGNSRLDFYVEDSKGCKLLMEVKGVTLEDGGIAKFPDAPTERGIKHIDELIKAVKEGYKAAIVFVIKMKGINRFSPNYDTHKAFGEALEHAKAAGVEIIAVDCNVEKDKLEIDSVIPTILGI